MDVTSYLPECKNVRILISYAHEDAKFAREIYGRIKKRAPVWCDFVSTPYGGSIRRSIDSGLLWATHVVPIISHNYWGSGYCQLELDAAIGLFVDGDVDIIPIWHGVSSQDVKNVSPLLACLRAVRSSQTREQIVDAICGADIPDSAPDSPPIRSALTALRRLSTGAGWYETC